MGGEPADGGVGGHTEQEEQVGVAGRRGDAEPHVVGVDEGDRGHRQVEAARRLLQRDHRAVQRQQQFAEPDTGWAHIVGS
ncbi:hypothetical protein AU194_09005 [Mycobacterium sp. GA-2829]|nr:hypothetical protein AU194_09005 [Mycobacterium sp. GA-2829]